MDAGLMRPYLTPLKEVPTPKGSVRHALKASEASFAGFGEAYFSAIDEGRVKGWKMHLKMHLNIIVPVGLIKIYLQSNDTDEQIGYILGGQNYQRLTVPPGLWMAFEGMNPGLNLLLNIASIEHDPSESVTAPLDSFPLCRVE